VGCALTLASWALGLAGCANLEEIKEDTCGNGVVEDAIGEDCDGQEHCGAPGTRHACLHTCDLAATPTIECPTGFGCGVDAVCRKPSGAFETLSTTTTATALDLFTGDVNGDGCHEVVHTTRRGTTITAAGSRTAGFCPPSQQDLPSGSQPGGKLESPAPLLTDLTGDERPDLLRMAKAVYETGMFVHVAGAEPTFASTLYPTVRTKESTARPLRVTYQGADALLLLIDNGGGMPGTGLAGVVNPINRPENLMIGLEDELDELTILQAVELGEMFGCAQCDEVVVGAAGDVRLKLYGLTTKTEMMNGQPVAHMSAVEIGPALELDSGASLRARNASVAVVDYNQDGLADVIVNATDQKLHIAYGAGNGKFHSTTPPDEVAPDGHTSVLDVEDETIASLDFRFVGANFDASTPEPELVGVPCPPSATFSSPACNPIAGDCEAVVLDIDNDGMLDIVSTDQQQPGLTLRRAGVTDGPHVSFADTQCPPHHLTTGDFDNDGIGDVAFFDQAKLDSIGASAAHPVTTLKVAYGNAFSEPDAPVESGRLEFAGGLTAGRFVPGEPSEQLYAARQIPDNGTGTALALVEGYGDRHLFAPFYFPATPELMMGDANLLQVQMLAAAAGTFGNTEAKDPPHGVAMVTRDAGSSTTPGKVRLWHIEGHGGGSNLRAWTVDGADGPTCDACVLVSVDLSPPGKARDGIDELLLLGDGEATVYTVEDGAFEPRGSFATSHSFRWVNEATQPEKYIPRPLVADLDGDALLDVVARSTDGAMVVLWGQADGSFDEQELLGAPDCGEASCGGQAIALLDIDGDGTRDLVVVGPQTFAFHAIEGRALVPVQRPADPVPIPLPPTATDFTAVSAADLDGDGVTDLALMLDSGSITLLRGIPVHE